MAEVNDDNKVYEGWPDPKTVGKDADATTGTSDDVATESVEAEVDELAAITAERDEYLDQLQRSRAEFANYRRRIEQQQQALRDIVQRDALAQFLPVIDDFDRGLAAIPESERGSSWVAGITMIQTKLAAILERAGVTVIDALNQPFDPALHEAVATEPGSKGEFVVEVYQKGYRVGDQLARPAMVKTGDAPSPSA
ncbi:MAG TPA: nucleotide exchange factor GrpE [Thermomicrobiales bacterium]|nr:nucleotide exchange factor GrpE [Thermomicrobiales bacterium]